MIRFYRNATCQAFDHEIFGNGKLSDALEKGGKIVKVSRHK